MEGLEEWEGQVNNMRIVLLQMLELKKNCTDMRRERQAL